VSVLILLAIDPGPASTGYALLSTEGPRTTHVRSGMIASTVEALASLGVATMGAVVIERPRGAIFQAFRAGPLLDTANVAGGISWVAQMLRVRVEELTAQEVRKLLCGKANAGNDDVEQAVRANVAQMPRQSNEHARDAIAVGLVGAWILAGRISRPPTKQPKPKARRKAA
jgi:Holliday junction resolvasome RuvABC endonuclease subunit